MHSSADVDPQLVSRSPDVLRNSSCGRGYVDHEMVVSFQQYRFTISAHLCYRSQ